MVPTSHPPVFMVFVWACLHKQCNGWATGAHLPPQARNLGVPGSLIYGVTTLEGAPALLGLFI